MISRNKSLAIISDGFDFKELTTLKQGEFDFVAFSLPTKLSLEKMHRPVYFPDEIIDLPDLNDIGKHNYGLTMNMCAELDSKFAEKFVFFKKYNINLFRSSFFVIKVFLDSFISSWQILSCLISEYGSKKIRFFGNLYSGKSLLEGGKSVVPQIMKEMFSSYSNSTDCKNAIENQEKWVGFRDLLNRVKDTFCYSHKTRGRNNDWYSIFVFDNRYDVQFIINNGMFNNTPIYEMRDFQRWSKIVQHQDYRIIHEKIAHDVEEIFNSLKDIGIDKYFLNDGNLLATFINKQIKKYVLETIADFLPVLNNIRNAFHIRRPGLILTSSCRFGLKTALFFEIARSLEVPVVTYQEGGGAGYIDWPLFNLDVDLSDYFLVYGEGVAKSPFLHGRAKMVPVGSVRLEVLKAANNKKINNNKKTIFVVLDIPKMNTYQHYPYNGGFFSEIYCHQIRIIKLLSEFKEINFKLKTVKGREFLYEIFTNGTSITLETRPLSAVLCNADGFLLDYPSTVLQECLLTKKPIALLYNAYCSENVCFDKNALEMLRKRIRISGQQSEFTYILRSFVDDVKSGVLSLNNEEFLQNYCIMEDSDTRLKNFFKMLCPWLS